MLVSLTEEGETANVGLSEGNTIHLPTPVRTDDEQTLSESHCSQVKAGNDGTLELSTFQYNNTENHHFKR